jgi:hypothetical protein
VTPPRALKGGQCRKLHQDPRINSDFPRFFPKTVCAGFKARDPSAYPCQVAALVSAKPPEFSLSISYPSESVLAQSLLSCCSIVPHIPPKCFYGLTSISYDVFSDLPCSIVLSHVDSISPVYKYRALSTLGYPSRIPLSTSTQAIQPLVRLSALKASAYSLAWTLGPLLPISIDSYQCTATSTTP